MSFLGSTSNVISNIGERAFHFIYSSYKILAIRVHLRKALTNQSAIESHKLPLKIIGEYHFINHVDVYKNDGKLLENTYCDYHFMATLNMSLNAWQYFQSPRFPANYPTHIKCLYRFLGCSNHYVEVIFEEIQLPEQADNCIWDKLILYDCKSSNASAIIDVLCKKPHINFIRSTGRYLLIEFNVSSNVTAKGFRGKFRFRYNANNNKVNITSFAMKDNSHDKAVRYAFIHSKNAYQFHKGFNKNACKYVYNSQSSRHGVFGTNQLLNKTLTIHNRFQTVNSNLYIQCLFEFYGQDNLAERVQIIFLKFNVPQDSNNSSTCSLNNSLQLLSNNVKRNDIIDSYCGAFLPKPIMSEGSRLRLQFVGHYAYKAKKDDKIIYYGFEAKYHFLTNYGITIGYQLERNCSFVYNSTEAKKTGLFTSPNFPGLYPPNLLCHYYFYGQKNERILLHFNSFDVEGIGSCEYTTSSDYVEFSNYITTDRKFPKYCGKWTKLTIQSDGNFFRVSFYANDRFERNGFRAFYEFTRKHKTISMDAKYSASKMTNLILPIKMYTISLLFCLILKSFME